MSQQKRSLYCIQMIFFQLISEFADRNEIEVSSLDGEGWEGSEPCRAVFDDGATTVEFHPQTRDLVRIESEVSTVDPATDEGVRTMTHLLKGNLASLATQKGSLTLSEDGRRVLLFERVRLAEADIHGFTEVVESFLNRLETFRRGLAAMA